MTHDAKSGRRRLAALLGVVAAVKIVVALGIEAVCGEGLVDQAFALLAGPLVVAAGAAHILKDASVPLAEPVAAEGETVAADGLTLAATTG